MRSRRLGFSIFSGRTFPSFSPPPFGLGSLLFPTLFLSFSFCPEGRQSRWQSSHIPTGVVSAICIMQARDWAISNHVLASLSRSLFWPIFFFFFCFLLISWSGRGIWRFKRHEAHGDGVCNLCYANGRLVIANPVFNPFLKFSFFSSFGERYFGTFILRSPHRGGVCNLCYANDG